MHLSYAQIEKGSKLVGVSFGGLSYSNSDNTTSYSNTTTVYKSDGSSFSISINPNVAWFIKDGLAVGGSVSLGMYSSKSKNSNTASSNTSENTYSQPAFFIGPLARYYFGGSSKGMPFVEAVAQVGFYGGKSKTSSSTGSSSETTTKPKGDWNVGASFGYEHFVTKNIGIYGSMGFNYGSSKTTYDYKPSTGTGYSYTTEYSRIYIPVNIGLQVHILSSKKGKK